MPKPKYEEEFDGSDPFVTIPSEDNDLDDDWDTASGWEYDNFQDDAVEDDFQEYEY